MTTQEEALVGIAGFLERQRVPYMVIGGLANIVWGEPRATLDIDVTVWVPEPQIPSFVGRLGESYSVLVDAPLPFIAAARVLPIETSSGVRLDIVFGLLPFERDAIDRARDVTIAGKPVRFCTPEDLLLMKIVSDRERDLTDAHALVLRRLADLDLEYLEPRITELARLLDRRDIQERWMTWKQESGDVTAPPSDRPS
jgi:hypothetical protein